MNPELNLFSVTELEVDAILTDYWRDQRLNHIFKLCIAQVSIGEGIRSIGKERTDEIK